MGEKRGALRGVVG